MRKAPVYGYLKLDSVTIDTGEFKHFDQHDVNSKILSYVETETNATCDYFVVDVTNGITWLKNFKMVIIIVPNDIIVHTKPVKVKKGKKKIQNLLDLKSFTVMFELLGGSTPILTTNIVPNSQYYGSKIIEYIITESPKFGNLLLNQRLKVEKFSIVQLKNKEIVYHHSGKINSFDSLKLIAVTTTRESLPFTLDFDINISEAEGPILVKKENISCNKFDRVTITQDKLRK